ncbi:glycosyltransferase family 2 protein [Allomesorhizobium camelthorni]|uniref:Glycosyltransferase family 2 protein n=1 Tax=Allomesorhizobium camelthorni TaxID=475069 RepID=A0A6G4WF04_9HYPH|nr:glycosyltransferase family A protein [Mesorhizobium camelthorni]NGO52928.1 glycosyltransferase family 2 protein [Mesorhizobium camelthorni]
MASIDVVIPCYNYEHFLPECVGSVLSQDVENLRVIVIDNASTDDSVGVARRLAAEDPRVEVVCHEKNLGPHASFNEAIDRAEADYFMILCADDFLTADTLVHGIAMLETFPRISCVLGTYMEPWVGTVLPSLVRQSGGGDLMEGTSFIERCCGVAGLNVPAHAMLVRTSVQKRVGHYRPTLPLMDDLEMALRLATKGLVAQLRGPLVVQRMHTSNLSQSFWDDRLNDLTEREAVFNSFFSHEGRDIPGAEKMHRSAKRRLAETAFWSAVSHAVRGRAREGSEIFKFGLNLSPASMLMPLGHLYRSEGALKRATAVISETFGRH